MQPYIPANDPTGQGALATAPHANVLERLLPAALGTAGSLLGGLVPIPGLDIGTAAAGGAAGSALGQKLENELTGGNASTMKAGVSGGIGAGIGQGLGALMGAGGSVLSGIGDNASAAEQATKDVADFAAVPKNARSALNMNTNAQIFKDYGLPFNVDTIKQVSPIVTGGETAPEGQAIISNAVRRAVSGANPVDLTGTNELAKQISASADMNQTSNTMSNAFYKEVFNRLSQTTPASGSLLQADPASVFMQKQALEKAAYNTKIPALQDAYKTVAQDLGAKLDASGVNDVVAKGIFSPEELNTLSQISPKLAEAADNASTVGQLRSLQAPFVQSSNLAQAAERAAEGALPTAEKSGGILGKLGSSKLFNLGNLALGGGALMHNKALEGLGLLMDMKDNPALMGTAAKGAGDILDTASTAGQLGAGAGTLGAMGALPAAVGQLATHGSDLTQGANNMSPLGQVGAPGAAGAVPGGQQPISTVQLSNALIAGLAADPALGSSLGPLLGQVQPRAQAAGLAAPALSAYQNTLGAAGGPQGPLGGLLARIGGLLTGGPASRVAGQQEAAGQALANALGIPYQEAVGMLPGLSTNIPGAQTGFAQPASLLSALGIGQ